MVAGNETFLTNWTFNCQHFIPVTGVSDSLYVEMFSEIITFVTHHVLHLLDKATIIKYMQETG